MSTTALLDRPVRVPLTDAAKIGTYGGYSTLRKKIADGELPAERVGRRLFVRRDDLEAMATPVVGHPTEQATIEKAIERIVSSAPRLSAEHRDRLAVILGGGAA
ncbi:DNA-binding protein [Luteipulveratus sp. YIM 133132]|uniref:DNA-binding protein n=1 Tax=Luteipulveratus flavus TaxID=3031728 RepID=UPI0023B11053|nr:DNA-binding protein [Luteipulveratus sp. YIM 133132]MDE9364125.1 DNA-binding protein [Luteipulveratus sp. YIM 133132]